MESKGEAARENQTKCAETVEVIDRFFELTESKGEATQENQAEFVDVVDRFRELTVSKGEATQENQTIVKLVDDQAPSAKDTKGSLPSAKVDHEEVTSFQEAPTNESIVEIDENEDVKGQLLSTEGASSPPGFVAKMVKNID